MSVEAEYEGVPHLITTISKGSDMRMNDTVLSPAVVVSALSMQAVTIDSTHEFTARYEAMKSLENHSRFTAQSILTGIFHTPELPSADEARDIIAWATP